MKTKINKNSRNLLIAMLLGNGTISNNFVFKMAHAVEQQEYLKWKIKLLNNYGIKNSGLKTYISSKGYNKDKTVVYTQLSIMPFIKVLKRVMYKPHKTINRKLLNRLDALGVAIWYMDDGHINFKKRKNGYISSIYIKISTCQSKENNQVIINYFKEVWNISFYQFSEGRSTYSLCCGTKEANKFIDIVKPHVLQIPSMWYKIRKNRTKDEYNHLSVGNNAEMPD